MTQLEIEAFLAVVKYGNISTAADKLFITQPALTRRIQIMETELGVSLFTRQKGQRIAQLTTKGRGFYDIAWKWQRLWEETQSISEDERREPLAVAGIGSFNHQIISKIAPDFLALGYHLKSLIVFSEEAYAQMEHGFHDLSFIELQDYTTQLPQNVESRPAYAEAILVATKQELPNKNGVIDPSLLKEDREIYMAWNKDFVQWHANHFDERITPYIILDDTTLGGYFLSDDHWLFASYTVCEALKSDGANIYSLPENPPRQIIYCLSQKNHKTAAVNAFLNILDRHLKTMPKDMIESLLS